MPIVIKRMLLQIQNHINRASWQILVLATACHMLLTWGMLWFAKEHALLPFSTFVYYYVVTTSTVGYGDFSATTELGRWAVALVQIPFGLALFGVLLGKVGQEITIWVKRAMKGDKDFSHLNDHIIIFGWHPTRTEKMIEFILADNKRIERRIVLAVHEDMEHPLLRYPQVDFVRLASFTDDIELSRTAIGTAAKVIVDGKDDDHTFTTALKLSPIVQSSAHICAHFIDETKAELLRLHCENVECSTAMSAEILVRSMQDPGSSRIQEELLSTLRGDTQFSLQIPSSVTSCKFGQLFMFFKEHHNATLLGVAHDRSGQNMDLNPPLSYGLTGGDFIHYIAPQRVLEKEVAWEQL
ncbi:potassium channel family protein [Pseudoalteromonas luteoviolacea]|uniref:Ion channel n=1 Tax=Pseudoalteromonas luteoviolacea (strain 2ta16) TaxID=1353533 RepID=V4JGK5_PSEL2|nr:potassium channel family protein [Pseudoalteromonas luteoviolacea]ESP94102.1 ion channel [Pseudoalteromonas luteoviolacea 2ta16]KZN42737.1 potassium channel protein [Pseudoalteromonas luteoviolacea NCIMB 1944]